MAASGLGAAAEGQGFEVREPILLSAETATESESESSARLRTHGWRATTGPLLRRLCRWDHAAKAALAVALLASALVAAATLGRRGSQQRSSLASGPGGAGPSQFLALAPLADTCPGTLPVAGAGPVTLTTAKWNSPGRPGGPVWLLPGGAVKTSMWGRSYFAKSCSKGSYDNSEYMPLQLLGKTLRYTVDLSGLGCGCNAALYLAAMSENPQPSQCSDYYCDAANVCGVTCDEIDIQEANKFAWHSTLHLHDDPAGGGVGYGGTLKNNWTAGDYGPGGKCIDTDAPVTVATSFPVDAGGALTSMDVTLSQDGKACTLSQNVYVGQYVFQGRNARPELSKSLASGMVPVISYWSSNGLLWLDGKQGDGRGHCAADDPSACPDSVQFSDFSVSEIGAPAGAPTSATVPVPTPPPVTTAQTAVSSTRSPPTVTPAAPEATNSPRVTTPVPTQGAGAPSQLAGYKKMAADEKAVCDEGFRILASCGMCGPNWGDVNKCKALCDAEPACKFFTHFSDEGCRLYSKCDPTWEQGYGVVSTIYEKGAAVAPGGAAADQASPAVVAPTVPPPAAPTTAAPPTTSPASTPPHLPLPPYEQTIAADNAVCNESARLDAPCGMCGPNWGDLGKCKTMCDTSAQCNFIAYFSDGGCRMYSKCESRWHQHYGTTKSSIYQKGR